MATARRTEWPALLAPTDAASGENTNHGVGIPRSIGGIPSNPWVEPCICTAERGLCTGGAVEWSNFHSWTVTKWIMIVRIIR